MANQGTYSIGSQDTVPASTTLTGTWSCAADQKAVAGSSGAATTQLQGNWWLYDATNDEVRQVDRVENDNLVYLKTGFTNVLSGATLRRITHPGMTAFGVVAVGGDITVIDAADNSVTFADGKGVNVPVPTNVHRLITPYIVDPGANDAQITYQL